MRKGLIAELAPRFRCITLDLPGSGLSDTAPASLAVVAGAIGLFIDHLDLHDVTLMLHDTGGWATMAAVGTKPRPAPSGLVGVNTFGWRPRGVLRLALLLMGSAVMRELTV